MAETAPSCSYRLPWIVTVITLAVLVAERFLTSAPPPSANVGPVTVAPLPTPATTSEPRVATLQNDLNEIRRVLDDAQSALAQRDREIATANDELRMLRIEVDSLRAKNAAPAP